MTANDAFHPVEVPRGTGTIWASVLGAPILWALHLQLNYVVIPHLCGSRRPWILHVITLSFMLLTALGMGVAARAWRINAPADTTSGDEMSRTRFLAGLGILMSTLFFVVILATGIPAFFYDPCQD